MRAGEFAVPIAERREKLMRLVVLQAGDFEHFLDATRACTARYLASTVIALVKEVDMHRARATALFTEVYAIPTDPAQLGALGVWTTPVDLCVVPFDDRLGVHYFKMRRALIAQRIGTIVSFNSKGVIREYARPLWILHTLFACLVVRAVYVPITRVWRILRGRLDMAGLYILALLALLVHWVKRMSASSVTRCVDHQCGLQGPRRLVLFIPSMGLGGAQQQLLLFMKHLDRKQWDPELVTLNDQDKFFEGAIRQLSIPITYLNPDKGYWMCGITWRLFKHLRAAPCHVLHAWMHYAAMLGAIAGTLAGTPIIVGSFRCERPDRFPWFYYRWQRGLDILTARLHSRLIANSHAVSLSHQSWACISGDKLITIYNGIETNNVLIPDRAALARLRAELGLSVDVRCIGIVGRLSPEKDHATFIRAAQLINAKRPDTCFLIVGSGPMRAFIETQIKESDLSDRVRVLGAREDARTVIALLDVLVLTSISEGLPNVLLEAGVAGTPVVTTAAGGATEVVVDGVTGFVVPCGDEGAIARRVLNILDDEHLKRRLTEAAVVRMRTVFSAEKIVAATQACYGVGELEARWHMGRAKVVEAHERICP